MRPSSLAAAAVVLLVYVAGLAVMPRHVFWSPDEGGKLLQARTIRIDDGLDYVLPYRGERIDPELRFYAYPSGEPGRTFIYPMRYPDGRFEFHWPMWFSAMLRVALVAGVWATYLIPLAAGWLTAVLSGGLAARIDARLEAVAIVVVGLATPVHFYSLGLWEHTLTSALGVGAVLVFVRGDGSFAAFLRSLPFLLLALALRIEMLALVLAMPLAAVVCGARRGVVAGDPQGGLLKVTSRRGIAVIAAILGVLALFLLSAPERHFERFAVLPNRLARMASVPGGFIDILINTKYGDGPDLPAAVVWIALAALGASLVAPFVKPARGTAVLTLAAGAGLGYVGVELLTTEQHFRCLHGLLPIVPFVVLAPHAIAPAWQRPRSPSFVVGAVTALYLFAGLAAVFVNSVESDGTFSQGLQWGQRYLLPLYALLAIVSLAGLLACLRRMASVWLRNLVVAMALSLVVVGVLLQGRGLREITETREALAACHERLTGQGPIVTDMWWLPASFAELYGSEEIYVVSRADGRREWIRTRDGLDEWVELARARGIDRFAFVSIGPFASDDPRFSGLIVDNAVALDAGLQLTRLRLPASLGEPR